MLKISDLTPEQLKKLYNEFTSYRDKECGGMARMSIHEFLADKRKRNK